MRKLSLSRRTVTEIRAIEIKGRRTRAFNLQTCRQGIFLHRNGGLFSHQYLCVAAVIQMQPDAELCLSTINVEQPPWYWSVFPSGWPDQVMEWTTGIAVVAVLKCSSLSSLGKFQSAVDHTRIRISIKIQILGKGDNLCINFTSEEIQRKKRVKTKFLYFEY